MRPKQIVCTLNGSFEPMIKEIMRARPDLDNVSQVAKAGVRLLLARIRMRQDSLATNYERGERHASSNGESDEQGRPGRVLARDQERHRGGEKMRTLAEIKEDVNLLSDDDLSDTIQCIREARE